jgi:hypothetical protein
LSWLLGLRLASSWDGSGPTISYRPAILRTYRALVSMDFARCTIK